MKGSDVLDAQMLAYNAGRIRNSVTVAPAVVANGTPVTSTGLLSLSNGAPVRYASGLPYGTNGELSVDIGGTVNYFNQGFAFKVAHRLVCDTAGSITIHTSGGLPFTATGALAVAVAE